MRDGWRKVSLTDCADYINGRAFKPSDFSPTGLPVIRIKQLLDASATADRFSGELDHRHRLSDGDLVFSWSGTLAVRTWNRGPAALNQHLFRVVEKPGVDRQWLRYALEGRLPELEAMSHGTTMRHITKKSLQECEVVLPPVRDQRRMADLLTALDDEISARENALERASAVLTSFREHSINDERNLIALGEVVDDIGVGESPRCLDRAPVGEEWGVIKISAVRPARFDASQVKTLPAGKAPKVSAELKVGDLLMTRSNTLDRVGMACLVTEGVSRLLLSDLVFRVWLDERRLTHEYAAHALNSTKVRSQIEAAAVGTSGSMKKVNQGIIRRLLVPVPTLDEQTRFVETARIIEAVIDAHRDAIQEQKNLKAALLGALLSGNHPIPESYDRFLTDENRADASLEPATV